MAQTHYTAFTVQSGQVPSTQFAFPVLISGSDARFKTVGNGGHVSNASGFDLRPYADSTLLTTFSYELVGYDGAAGTFEMWVNVTILTTTTPIYIGYGDSLSSDGSSATTWDSDYTLVCHLQAVATIKDSSQEVNTGTNDGATNVTGKIGGGSAFVTGSTQSIILPNADSLGNINTYTISGWFKTSNTADAGNFYGEGNDGDGNPIVRVNINDIGVGRLDFLHRSNATVAAEIASASNYSDNAWHKFDAIRRSVSSFELFVDNTSVGTDTEIPPGTTTTNKQRLGALERASLIHYLTGSLDEIHRSKIVRSADWLTTEYNNQSAPGTFYSVGTEVVTGGGGGGQVTHNTRSHPLGTKLGYARRITGNRI